MCASAQAQHPGQAAARSVRHRAGVLTHLERLRRNEESSKNSTSYKMASLTTALICKGQHQSTQR